MAFGRRAVEDLGVSGAPGNTFEGWFRGLPILVTGHTGFKGSWLCHWLVRLGAHVTGVALEPETKPALFSALGLAGRIDHRVIDIRDGAALERLMREVRPAAVLHLAAQSLVRRSYTEPKVTWNVNVGGTVNLLEAIRAVDSVGVCVVVTSDKCYENHEREASYREDDPLGGFDPYSSSKGAAEIAVASWRRSFFAASRCRIATARAGNVIGGGDWSADRIVPDFARAIAAGQPLRLRNPRATRPWQHVLEPLSGYLLLLWLLGQQDAESVAEAWNFGPPDECIITAEALARQLVVAWGSGTVEIAEELGQPHEAGLLHLDCSKAKRRLGWRARWGIVETVQRTAHWYREFSQGADARELVDADIDSYHSTTTD